MKKVPSKLNLQDRKGVWYYRRRVPRDCVAAIGRKFIQFSLKTSSLAEAAKLREAADVEWTARFEAALSASTGTTDEPSSIPVGRAEPGRILALMRTYVDHEERERRKRWASSGKGTPTTNEDRDFVIDDTEQDLSIIRSLDDPRRHELIDLACRRARNTVGVSEEELPETPEFVQLAERAFIEICRRKLADLRHEHGAAFFDASFDPARKPTMTLGELADQLRADKREDAALNGTSQKYVDKIDASLKLLTEMIGSGTSVRDVSTQDCKEVARKLAHLPTNRTKLYPKLSIAQAIKQGQADGKPTLSSLTQNQYIGVLKELMNLGVDAGLLDRNPAERVTPLKRDAVAAGERRAPFADDEVTKLFKSPHYPTRENADGPLAWRFWMPLVCLFSGMRPNEVCQLLARDVRRTKAGTWFFDITETGDGDDGDASPSKSLKTSSSKRQVPVHPELVKLGFLAFVDQARAKGEASRLFDSIKPNKYGNIATNPLKWFARHLGRMVALRPRQSFYSFRHTFRDALRRTGAHPDTLQAFGGWSQGKAVSDNYGTKCHPDHQAAAMAAVTYPGLDLSHLHPTAALEAA